MIPTFHSSHTLLATDQNPFDPRTDPLCIEHWHSAVHRIGAELALASPLPQRYTDTLAAYGLDDSGDRHQRARALNGTIVSLASYLTDVVTRGGSVLPGPIAPDLSPEIAGAMTLIGLTARMHVHHTPPACVRARTLILADAEAGCLDIESGLRIIAGEVVDRRAALAWIADYDRAVRLPRNVVCPDCADLRVMFQADA